MPKKKIVDEGEVIRWFEQGWSYQQMTDEYRRKYGIDTRLSMWGNFRQRRGLTRRIARDDDLLPWAVAPQHRQVYAVQMLRLEARVRAGMDIEPDKRKRLRSWLETLRRDNTVVHYDAATEEGFSYVPREPGDDDIIRRPPRKTTQRRNADTR
ncbi:hypothetical protein H0H10_18860 [Streptomyces sp. TRM S81-3]|uniref:Immunity repressor n=1 Tax=Streptomyces griseicoloratus TaxID=2752516 RepID=A0A926L6W4_9ACTN|nr:hypothetical protein [Streptomyces griseicoloratus]MBD0421188.1 hypothetical protein [Streptomyces griseicoloratus]